MHEALALTDSSVPGHDLAVNGAYTGNDGKRRSRLSPLTAEGFAEGATADASPLQIPLPCNTCLGRGCQPGKLTLFRCARRDHGRGQEGAQYLAGMGATRETGQGVRAGMVSSGSVRIQGPFAVTATVCS